jgi:hypothetical protein
MTDYMQHENESNLSSGNDRRLLSTYKWNQPEHDNN